MSGKTGRKSGFGKLREEGLGKAGVLADVFQTAGGRGEILGTRVFQDAVTRLHAVRVIPCGWRPVVAPGRIVLVARCKVVPAEYPLLGTGIRDIDADPALHTAGFALVAIIGGLAGIGLCVGISVRVGVGTGIGSAIFTGVRPGVEVGVGIGVGVRIRIRVAVSVQVGAGIRRRCELRRGLAAEEGHHRDPEPQRSHGILLSLAGFFDNGTINDSIF